MIRLRAQLGLNRSFRVTVIADEPIDTYDWLITQDERPIITQNEIHITIQQVSYDLHTQSGLALITQDGRIIKVGF